MWFLVVGVVLLVLKMAEIAPVAGWGWPWVLGPFGLAVLWWALADKLGFTQARAMRKMDERKTARRERDMKALGLDVRREKRIRVLRDAGTRANKPPPPSDSPPPPDIPRRDPRP